ncbi:MAG: T9SS type A sorting domain-containing protein [Bacteroidaceae bacterium]|nr:T9SS type A sorting domain-containing protein [Bacteroidaceae bacterium]
MEKYKLLAAALLAASSTLTAQTVQMEARMGSESTISPLPKELTKDGKAYMAVVNFDHNGKKSEIDIYDSPGPQGMKLSIPVPLQESSDTYYEKAEGFTETVKIDNKFFDWFESDTTYTPSMIPEMEAFIRKNFFRYNDDDFKLIEFTDADGIKAFVGNNLREDQFYEYNRYGRKYPYEYWGITKDSCICMYHYFGYHTEFDFTNAVWTKDLDYSLANGYEQYALYLRGFLYQDIDNSFYPTSTVYASQNIFNDDDNWEYLTIDVEPTARRGDAWMDNEGTVRRSVNQSTTVKGIKIMNDKGIQSAYIDIPDEEEEKTAQIWVNSVCVLNGLVYILTSEDVRKGSGNDYHWNTYEGIYVIDPTTAEVKSISRAPSRMSINPTVVEQGGRLNIQVSEPMQNDNVTVSSMSGQVLESSAIKEGNAVSIGTGAMPKGIYNVTLRGNGGTPENQRVIIK